MSRRDLIRAWWPAIAVLLLAIVSVDVLHTSFRRAQISTQATVAAVDQLAQARLRTMRAYLVLERELGEDPTFGGNPAAAELQAARDALDNWREGRSDILDLRGREPLRPELLELADAWSAALADFHGAVLAEAPSPLEARAHLAAAERAASRLEGEVYAALREEIREARRSHWIRLFAWAGFLVLVAVGLSIARAAQRRAEAARQETERRLVKLRALAPVGIVACDDDGSIRLANPWWCDSTGRTEEEWLGRPWWEALPEAEREEAGERWTAAVREGHPSSIAEFLLGDTADRPGPIWVLARWAPNPLERMEGRWVVTFTDVSERRKVEDQLRQSQKMEVMGQLTGAIAHDFNNLLTIIVANGAMLEGAVGPDDEPLLADLRRAADGGVELVQTLLSFSRRSELKLRPVDLRWVIDENAGLAMRLLPRSVKLDVVQGPSVPLIMADPGALQQILLNLVTNARDAMPEGGELTIEAGEAVVSAGGEDASDDVPPGRWATLEVRDSGVGMDEETLERIFEAFFTTKPDGEGTGLGLSNIQTLVQRHGGHVRVESEAGVGTVFRLYFPSAEEAEEAGDSDASERGTASGAVSA